MSCVITCNILHVHVVTTVIVSIVCIVTMVIVHVVSIRIVYIISMLVLQICSVGRLCPFLVSVLPGLLCLIDSELATKSSPVNHNTTSH